MTGISSRTGKTRWHSTHFKPLPSGFNSTFALHRGQASISNKSSLIAMADLSHCSFARLGKDARLEGKAYHKDATRQQQATKDLVRSQADNFRSDTGRKMFEFLPNVLGFDLNQTSGLEVCRAAVFAFDLMAADTFES